MLFAHLKRILRLGRLRLRGPAGAREEFLLAATAQNLRKLAKLRSTPTAFAEQAKSFALGQRVFAPFDVAVGRAFADHDQAGAGA